MQYVKQAIVVFAVATVLYSTTSLRSHAEESNPWCCVDDGDCQTGSICDRSTPCLEMPGTCVPVLADRVQQ